MARTRRPIRWQGRRRRARCGGGGAADPAVIAQVTAFRTRLQASIGEVVLAMVNIPRHRNQTLADELHRWSIR